MKCKFKANICFDSQRRWRRLVGEPSKVVRGDYKNEAGRLIIPRENEGI